MVHLQLTISNGLPSHSGKTEPQLPFEIRRGNISVMMNNIFLMTKVYQIGRSMTMCSMVIEYRIAQIDADHLIE